MHVYVFFSVRMTCCKFIYNLPHVMKMLKRCRNMLYEVKHMWAYLAFCWEEPTRILNCLKFSPVLAIQGGHGFSRTFLATHPYIIVQLSYTLSPNVACSCVFSPSQNNRQVFITNEQHFRSFLWVLYGSPY